MLAAATLANLALRTGAASLSSAIAVFIIAGPLLGPHVLRNRTALSFTAAAVVFAIWLPVRASIWLTSLNSATVASCLIAAAVTVHPIRLRFATVTIATLLNRFFNGRFFVQVIRKAVAPLTAARSDQLVPILRGLAIAAVPFAVLAALLASADAVFAHSFSTDMDPSSFISHAVLTLMAFAGVAGLVSMTAQPVDESFTEHRPLGATEALVLLASIGGLYAAFAIVQLFTALGGADLLLKEQGTSYAEYASSGFFQLLWVAGLTVGLLLAIRTFVTDGQSFIHQAVRFAGAVVSLLTTLIAATAIVRLWLYTDEFGQTTLRWYCTAFAWMLGALFVVLAIGHSRKAEHLLPAAALVIVAATLLAVNVANPEARVAEHNLGRAYGELDTLYLTTLSADAWPALLANEQVTNELTLPEYANRCERADEAFGYGIFGFNLAHARLECD